MTQVHSRILFHNSPSLINTAHILMGMGPSTGALQTYTWQHHLRKIISLSKQPSAANSSSGTGGTL